MNMSLEQYILNPMGKKNAVLNATAREAIASDYIKRYGRLMMREHSHIQYYLYKDEDKNKYIAHFLIPSETIDKFYYDVLLEFTTDSNIQGDGSNLFKYNCRFYSNDPAFVYTYAYVFRSNGLLIEQLNSKMSKDALHKEAKEKNPGNNVGYVKTIYFAYLYMKSRGLNQKSTFTSQASRLTYASILSKIEDADSKITKRVEAGDKIKKRKAHEKERSKNIEKNKPTVAKTINGKINTIGKISGKKKHPITIPCRIIRNFTVFPADIRTV